MKHIDDDSAQLQVFTPVPMHFNPFPCVLVIAHYHKVIIGAGQGYTDCLIQRVWFLTCVPHRSVSFWAATMYPGELPTQFQTCPSTL